MLSKEQKYGITLGIGIAVSVVVFVLLRVFGFGMMNSVLLSLIPFAVIALAGMKWMTKAKENFDNEGQVINIIQNCGGAPQPAPPGPLPPPSPLNKDEIMKWIETVDPSLTSACKSCIVDSALKMWNSQTLAQLKTMPLEKQKPILDAMLAFDCNKQCVIPPSGLNESAVDQWLRVLMPDLVQNCHHCVLDVILKSWSKDEFSKLLQNAKGDQIKVVEALIAFNCPKCDVPAKIPVVEVQKWVGGLLTGAKPDCYNCIVETVVKMWSTADFARVKSMDKKSQRNVVQALLALSCNKECVEVPSGLTPQEVSVWINSVLVGENQNCNSCIVAQIIRLWTPAMLQSAKLKSKVEQNKILQGIIAMDCKNVCIVGNTKQQEVQAWVHRILPNANNACSACVVNNVVNNYDKLDFHNLLLRPSIDQNKTANLVADFNCPDVCVLAPPQESDYLMY